jgi:outer membrane protein OmpA-like peptidoglycan-associated protein
VVDQMQPGDGAPQGWNLAAAASIRGLAQMSSGTAEIKDTGLTISGLATDGSAADAARAALRAALPASIRFTDQIKAKEPPPPPPPPPAEPAPSAAPPQAKEGDIPGVPATTASLPAPIITQPPPAHMTPAPPESKPAPTPAPAAEAAVRNPAQTAVDMKAKACEDQLQGLVRTGQIAFELASAELDPASLPTLDRLAQAAKTCPGMQIEVAGHASSEGSAIMNQQLSLKRARSVVTYLVEAGVDAAQLQPVGYGASRPVAPNDGNENMAKNRRIEFTVRANPRQAN